MPQPGRITIRITNALSEARKVVVEPWTGEYTLRPGKAFDIVAEGDLGYPLEVVLDEGGVIVHCFDSKGASMSIFEDGKELTKSE
jgi:hypothetical protein